MSNQEFTYLQPHTHQAFKRIVRSRTSTCKTHGYVPDNAENKLVYLKNFSLISHQYFK